MASNLVFPPGSRLLPERMGSPTLERTSLMKAERLKRLPLIVLFISTIVSNDLASADEPTVIVVVGAAGTPEYGRQFAEWTKRWKIAARTGGARFVSIGQAENGTSNDKAELKKQITELQRDSLHPVWLVLIGHGTWDYRDAKLNLRGPDVSHKELAEWLSTLARPLAVVNCTSSSAPFLPALSGANRVTLTATKNGSRNELRSLRK